MQKKDTSLESVLKTIRRGGKYNYEQVANRLNDELSQDKVTDEKASLCCDVIEALLVDYKAKRHQWPLSRLCLKLIQDQDSANDTAIKTLGLIDRSLKKEMRNGLDEDVINHLPLNWIVWEVGQICADDKSDTASKACVKLCKTLAKTELSKEMSDTIIGHLEDERVRPADMEFEELPHHLRHLIPFAKSGDHETALKTKKYLKDFCENFSLPEGKKSPELEKIKKQVLKL